MVAETLLRSTYVTPQDKYRARFTMFTVRRAATRLLLMSDVMPQTPDPVPRPGPQTQSRDPVPRPCPQTQSPPKSKMRCFLHFREILRKKRLPHSRMPSENDMMAPGWPPKQHLRMQESKNLRFSHFGEFFCKTRLPHRRVPSESKLIAPRWPPKPQNSVRELKIRNRKETLFSTLRSVLERPRGSKKRGGGHPPQNGVFAIFHLFLTLKVDHSIGLHNNATPIRFF